MAATRMTGNRDIELRIVAVLRTQGNALKHGIKYVEQGLEAYEKRYREQSIQRMKRTATLFGLTVVEPQVA